MKVDVDTIIYLLITIAILVISGLGSRRRKRMQQTQAPASPDTASEEGKEEEEPPLRTPLDQLRDRFMSDIYGPGQMRTPGSQPTVQDWFGSQGQIVTAQQSVPGQQPEEYDPAGESLEETVDEEEAILEEIRRRKEEPESERPEEKAMKKPIETITEEIPQISGLFEGEDEIKKAIIYNMVLNRKY